MNYRVTIEEFDPGKESKYDSWTKIYEQRVSNLNVKGVVEVVIRALELVQPSNKEKV